MAFILVVNPGSTSTKAALYEDARQVRANVLRYDPASLAQFRTVWDQFDFRMASLRAWAGEYPAPLSAVVGVGGLLRSLSGGTYSVNEKMLRDARANLGGEHASNIGCAMAAALAVEHHCGAYVVDPVSVDEFEPLARYSGHPLIARSSFSHALNIHAAARRAAGDIGKPLGESSFVVAHLGGGISVAPVRGGRIIDVNDASSDGPFSPERTGGLPLQQFITLCYSGSRGEADMRNLVRGQGGLTAYLGTNSAVEVESMIAGGDAEAAAIYEAMAYQIAKEIGAMAAALGGDVDAVVLTGGLARSAMQVGWITQRVKFLGRVIVYPGEDEMEALAAGALRVVRDGIPPLEY